MRLRLLAAAGILTVAAVSWLSHRLATAPASPGALVERVREVARLETLQVRLSTSVSYAPHPSQADTLPAEVLAWALHTLRPKAGRAEVWGLGRLGVELAGLDAGAFQAQGRRLHVRLPAIVSQVELDLERTTLLESNLDSKETQELFEKGRRTLEAQLGADASLRARARASAENALRSLFLSAGYEEVVFVDSVPSI